MSEIQKVGVVGCGLMGGGIAQICAQAGYEPVVCELDQAFLDRGMKQIKKNLDRAVEKGYMTESDRDVVMGRIHPTLQLGDLADSDLIIEAIVENRCVFSFRTVRITVLRQFAADVEK